MASAEERFMQEMRESFKDLSAPFIVETLFNILNGIASYTATRIVVEIIEPDGTSVIISYGNMHARLNPTVTYLCGKGVRLRVATDGPPEATTHFIVMYLNFVNGVFD